MIAAIFLSSSLAAAEDEESSLKNIIAKNKNDYVSMTKLGALYQDKGDRKRALKFLKDAVKTNPDYPQAHFFLGRQYFLMQENEEALNEFNIFKEKMLLQKDLSEDAKDAYIRQLYYIADMCFNIKEFTEFKNTIDEILKLNPDDATAFYNLGVYNYTYKHNRSYAYQYFNKAINLSPDSYIAKKARYAIEFIRSNPDPRISPDFSFIDQEYRE